MACPRFVDFVERGITSGREVLGLAEGYLEPLQRAEVDTLVLGCTHYPLLSGVIQLAMGDAVTLVSSAEETAKDLLRVLTERDLLRPHDARRRHRGFRGDRRSGVVPGPRVPFPGAGGHRRASGPASRRRPEVIRCIQSRNVCPTSSVASLCAVRITVLGCSGSVVGPDSPASGYLLTAPDTPPLVIDFGGGVLGALQRYADPNDVHVLLSHLHADHCLDLPGLFVWRRYHPTPAKEPRHHVRAQRHLDPAGGGVVAAGR